MASKILNFIVENYLSNFIEINPNQTKASLWSGEVQMSNVKIKKELFKTMNIPFLEVVHGYIGSIRIKMSMPMFYKYPIQVCIDKVFFHARQKDINEINKEEEIKNMEEYKLSTLKSQEILMSQLDQINTEESTGMKKQIINNLYIEINDVVFRYDDNVSYKKIPYSLGLILKQLSLSSTKSDFKLLKNKDEVIQCEDESYKKIYMDDMSIFWDCFDNQNDLQFKNLIKDKFYNSIKSEIKQYLGPQLDFYVYCLSEIYHHSNEEKSHQYILHNIEMELNATINENINKNLKPEYIGGLEFQYIIIDFSLKQIETILKVLSYMNLSSLYHEGLSKDYYKKTLTDEEKKLYIREYNNYFHQKYELKKDINFPEQLKIIEDGISLYEIQLMRAASYKKSGFFGKKTDLETKIKEEEKRFFLRNEKYIKHLKGQLKVLIESEQEYNQSMIKELEKDQKVELDNLTNLPDSYLHYVGKFYIKKIKLILHEDIYKDNLGWNYKDKIFEIELMKLSLEGNFFKKGLSLKISLEDTSIKQDKIKSPNYSSILFGDINSKGKILDIEFIINPSLPCSDMKFTMKAERGIYIICDLYVIQWIKYKVMKVLSTSINFNEIANYAKDSVSQYIQKEYANNFLQGNYQHTNIHLDILFNSPVIILPLNIFENENTQCIKLSLGKFKGFSKLPPRKELGIDYKKSDDESKLLDIYEFDLQGLKISTVSNCTYKNRFHGEDNFLLKEFDTSIICNILIEPKNIYFPIIQILIKIPFFDFQIDEFQILFFIDYLGNINKGNNILQQETYTDSKKEEAEKVDIENFIKNLTVPEIKIEDDNLKYMKQRIEEFDQEKKRKQKEKRYKQFVRSYSIELKKNKILNSFDSIEKSKKSLYFILEFHEARFIIKKNYTDLTVEDYIIYDQKSLKFEFFIIESGDMMVKLVIKDIGLFDKDKEEINNINYDENNINNINTTKKKLVINKNFTNLIKSSEQLDEDNLMGKIDDGSNIKEKQGFIIINYLYRVELDDMTINIEMNNLNITLSFDSLKRIYQFSMYYLDKYQKVIDDSNLLNKNPNNISPEDKKEYMKALQSNSDNKLPKLKKNYIEGIKNGLNIQADLDKIKTLNKKSDKNVLIEENNNETKKERIKNTLRVKFTMKNTIFNVPLYPQNSNTPIVSFFFNMIYNQEWVNEYENIYTLPNKKILETHYFVQDSKMNLIINKLNLDVTFPYDKRRSLSKKKILNDLRIFIDVSMNIIPKVNQSLILTDIILEPLLINLSVKQLVYLMELYNIAMKFLNYDMNEKYIPLMKPEYLIYGIPKRRKMTFKQCFKKIVLIKKLQKKLNNELKILKKKKGNKIDNVNTSNFNSYIECNVKIDQIGVTFFDINGPRHLAIFNSDFSNLSVKFLSNSIPKDKKNMGNAIVEMVTASEMPIDEYNVNNLGFYLKVYFTFEANYHNTILSEFEPLIERINIKILMYQVASFIRSKCFVDIDEMININISSNAVKALNLFMLKYSEEFEDMEILRENSKKILTQKTNKSLLDLKKNKKPYNYEASTKNITATSKEGAVVFVYNKTGVELNFYFESNPNYIIGMKPEERLTFSKADLKNARGLEEGTMTTNLNTLSVSIMKSGTIKGINFNQNNSSQYKLNVMKNFKSYTIYFNTVVKTQGIVKKIIFSSSLSIFNDTIYDNICIMINNEDITQNNIDIPKNERKYIPISWFLCEAPKSEIRIKLNEEEESYLVFNHISEIISEPIDKKIKEENLKNKKKFFKRYENCKNFEKKDIIEKVKNDAENLRKSQIIEIKNENSFTNEMNEGKKYYICFDFYIYQSKGISDLLKPEMDEEDDLNQGNTLKRTNTNISELVNISNSELEFSYEFIVYVRPCMTFINSLPFDLDINVNDSIKFKLEKNKNENIYDLHPNNLIENNINLKIILYDYEKQYTSDYNFTEENLEEIELYEIQNNYSERANFNIVKLPKEVELESDVKYTLNLKGYSCLSYNIFFYCDYIINNRLSYPLWFIPCDKKGIDKVGEVIGAREKKLEKSRLSIITLTNNEDKFIIRSENSQWSKAFDINTIGINGAISIDDQVKSIQYQTHTKSKDIACLISKSQKYNKSIVIIFEQRFLLYNNLGFDIFYRQENDIDIFLKDKNEDELFYKNKKKIYRLGLFNSDERTFNYSQPFSAENISDVDLTIKIGKSDIPKYEHFKNNIYTNNDIDYYILIRIVNKTYDDGTFYLLIFLPLFPFLEIINETDSRVSIYETKNEKDPLIVEPHLKERKKFPLIWKNTIEPKDNLYFEIYGFKQIFSFAKLEKELITIDKNNSKEISNFSKYILYHIYRKNKGQTRVIKIIEISEEEKNNQKFKNEINLLQRKRPKSSLFSIQLKGIGVSIINEVPKELFFISFYDIKMKYISNFLQTRFGTSVEITENIELYIKNIQIDYCLNDSFKNIIFPTNQMIPSIEERLIANKESQKLEDFVPFFSMLITRQQFKDTKKNEEISFYKQIDLVMQEFNIKVEQYALTCLLELVNEIMSFFDYSTKLDEIKKGKEETENILETMIDIPLEKLVKENEDLERITINILMIGCLKFNITVRLDLSQLNISILPRPIMRILGSVGNSLARITDGQLKFSEKIFTNIYKNSSDITSDLIKHYSKEGIKQIYKILGSTDLIGNPVNFIEGLGSGFFELINEPRKGFLLGPKQFGKGLLKGLGGVLSGVVGGSFGVVQRISGTLYGATQSMMGKGHEYIIEEEEEPTNIITGIGKGIYGGLKEIASGITGIFTQPYKNFQKKKSAKSIITGIGSGIFGLFIAPFAAVLKIINSISTGAKNTITTISGKKILITTRFRHPRVMVGGDEPIHCYEIILAEAKELLWRIQKIETDYIYYAKYFVSGDKGFNSVNKNNIHKMCMAIITDKYLFVIYNSSKVIFQLKIKKITKCSLHFIDDKYLLAFSLNKGPSKGFRIENTYSLVACQINDIFEKMELAKRNKTLQKIKAPTGMYTTKNELEIENDQLNSINNETEKIDKSSYNKTLVDNDDSVLTFDNNENIKSSKDKILDAENTNKKIGLNIKRQSNINNTEEEQQKSSRRILSTQNDDFILDLKNIK